jgi:adenosylcobyric acid synthase
MTEKGNQDAIFQAAGPLKLKARTLMVQGTSSSVGKSVLVAGLCRILRQDGYRVAPFKSQNMALNSYVTAEGGEIGRAQAVQAAAAGIPPSVAMNPVLLKPQADGGSQIVIRGRASGWLSAAEYYKKTPELMEVISESLTSLGNDYDIIVIEGAGSPAEINLKEREIVNMRTARLAGAPVLLAGDIDRGGVFAAFVGTLALLDDAERAYVKSFIVNKFRGDIKLLLPGLEMLEARTGLPVLGVVPYFRDIRIAEEDSVFLEERRNTDGQSGLEIAVIKLPHISNYDDFDPLETDGVNLRYVTRPAELGHPQLIILPGTKSTVNALNFVRDSGLAAAIHEMSGKGIPVIGICGGYQMLGRTILDPDGVESGTSEIEGLGLLDVVTRFAPVKATRQVQGRVTADRGLLTGLRGMPVTGYEIHMGQTESTEAVFQIANSDRHADGSISADGSVWGTYLHGVFGATEFRRGLLDNLRRAAGISPDAYPGEAETADPYDQLADLLRESLDMPRLYQIIEEGIDG